MRRLALGEFQLRRAAAKSGEDTGDGRRGFGVLRDIEHRRQRQA